MRISIEFDDDEEVLASQVQQITARLEKAIRHALAPWGGKLGRPSVILEPLREK